MNKKTRSILLIIILIGFSFYGCKHYEITKDVEVLTINEKICRGNMIGRFLGSADGSFSNDAIIVGMKVSFGNQLILFDSKLLHAELSYYRNRNVIPVYWSFDTNCMRLRGYLHGRRIYDESLYSIGKKLEEWFEMERNR